MKRVNLRWASPTLAGLLLAATLAGLAGPRAWVLELFAHFPVHYAAAALVLTAVSVSARSLFGTGASLLCLALNAYAVLPFLADAPRGGDAPGASIRLVSANIGSAERDVDPRLAALIRREKPDVLLLIELTPSALAALDTVLQEHYPHRYTVPREDYFGIGLFSRHPLAERELLDLGYRDVPAISVRIDTPQPLRLVGVHLEWPMTPGAAAGRNTQLHNLARQLADTPDPTVLLGDFNLTRWTARFDRLLLATGLRDAAVGFGWQPTWPTFLPRLGIAIDHCLVSPSLRVRELKAGRHVGSDHYPLIVDLAQ